MDLVERLVWLLIGGAMGFVLGYIVRALTEIKEELHDVDVMIKEERDERGVFKIDGAKDVLLLIVVIVVAWAAFSTQSTNNGVKANQERIEKATEQIQNVAACNQLILNQTVTALNERTEYSFERSKSNADLQKSQARYLRLLLEIPPLTDQELQEALVRYAGDLQSFVEVESKSSASFEKNPYPQAAALDTCLYLSEQGESRD